MHPLGPKVKMCIVGRARQPSFVSLRDLAMMDGFQMSMTPLTEDGKVADINVEAEKPKRPPKHTTPGKNLRMIVRDTISVNGGVIHRDDLETKIRSLGYNGLSGPTTVSWMKKHGYVEEDAGGILKLIRMLPDEDTVDRRPPK